ncbi:MAG: D-cysteine desulfhydrase family protein [Candidatus Firestonebacteria bacterium]
MKRIKRLSLFAKPTRIDFLERLTKHLGGPEIYIKRDDLIGVALGGNKVRKLEYLLADALEKKADVIFTTGGPQSNHARITAGICAELGLKCVLVLGGAGKYAYEGNLLLDKIFGAEIVMAGTRDFTKVPEIMEAHAEEYRKKGRHPYIIPLGGANGTGALGYYEAFVELQAQSRAAKKYFDRIVIADGSGGTHAGLEAGKFSCGSDIEIIGISVLFKKAKIVNEVYKDLGEALKILNCAGPHSTGITVYDEYLGPGYAIPSPLTLEAIKTVGRLEGIVLDPVYTGKAFGGLMDLIEKKKINKREKILFIHTGGYPGMVNMKEEHIKRLIS